jgi:hypothetical protein
MTACAARSGINDVRLGNLRRATTELTCVHPLTRAVARVMRSEISRNTSASCIRGFCEPVLYLEPLSARTQIMEKASR